MQTSSTPKHERKSFTTKLLLLISFVSLGSLLVVGAVETTTTYSSPKICEKLSPETLTVTAASQQYQQCKASLRQILTEANFEKQDQQFNAIVKQLRPNDQLTGRAIAAFDAVFWSVQVSYAKQLPGYIQVKKWLLTLLLSFWLTACVFIVANLLEYSLRALLPSNQD